ncbi:Exocyst complex component SEC3A [Vitis vinifera]|uniref:Exocyst complex component SEC3A n=1 Tax=Vitis vinifera TaxID=29760 RepID=A0A438K1X7_VITVI|nr:Exocyst complex component SEC3A [Vitis vinifera]
MAKSSADDEELRRACEAAIEGTKQKIVMSIRVAKSRGIWGKSGKLGRNMAKPRVLALSTKAKAQRTKAFLRVLKYSTGGVLEGGVQPVVPGSKGVSNSVSVIALHSAGFIQQPAKLYKLKHLSKVEVIANDPSGCTFMLGFDNLRSQSVAPPQWTMRNIDDSLPGASCRGRGQHLEIWDPMESPKAWPWEVTQNRLLLCILNICKDVLGRLPKVVGPSSSSGFGLGGGISSSSTSLSLEGGSELLGVECIEEGMQGGKAFSLQSGGFEGPECGKDLSVEWSKSRLGRRALLFVAKVSKTSSRTKTERELRKLEFSVKYDGPTGSSGKERVQEMSGHLVRSLGVGRFLDWGAVEARGSAGGLVVFRDNRVLELLEMEGGAFFVSYCFKNCEDGVHQRGLQHDQISKGKEELFQSAARRRFLEIIEELKLIDIPLNGGAFTWCGGLNDQSMSRFGNMQIKVDGFKELIKSRWMSYSFTGNNNFVLASKLKALKKDLKIWNRELFGCVANRKANALNRLGFYEVKEREAPLVGG